MTSSSTPPPPSEQPTADEPTQLSAHLKSVQGAVYSAIGAATGSDSYSSSGAALSSSASSDLSALRTAAQAERVEGKVQSAWGMLTGDQGAMKEGNLKAEGGEWKKAAATEEGGVGVPLPSWERVQGKVESAVGMVTGDVEKQKAGNLKAEKAEWTKG